MFSTASISPLTRPQRRLVGSLVLVASLFVLYSSLDDGSYAGNNGRRSLLSHNTGTNANGGKRERLALIRPFAPRDDDALLASFQLWDTRWPCSEQHKSNPYYDVDLVLSYSRRLDLSPDDAADAAQRAEIERGHNVIDVLRAKFQDRSGWADCFAELKFVQADLPLERDVYERHPVTGMPDRLDWVAGPNGQFRRSMSEVMKTSDDTAPEAGQEDPEARDQGKDHEGENPFDAAPQPRYTLAFIMEADNQPQRTGWLDELLQEIHASAPFAILGSRYKGHNWDDLRNIIPQSLLEHLNGNAVYNLTHPLLVRYLSELESEAGTPYEAVPYDYRISQMAHEGQYGTPPEFPFPWMTNPDGSQITLPPKPGKFKRWWNNIAGFKRATGRSNPIKQSQVMSNFAQTNYLPEHLGEGQAALVHGLNVWRPWNPDTHKISLVVSGWDDREEHQDFLSSLGNSRHPFQEVIFMEDPFLLDHAPPMPKSSVIPFKVQDRHWGAAGGLTDVCDANVESDWFYYTNTYHNVASRVDLLFTHDVPISRPLVPYTPAESLHCQQFVECRETLRLAREIYPPMDRIVLDMDLLYHVPSRDAFCRYWKSIHGNDAEVLIEREGGRHLAERNGTPLAPTATAYVAYLYRTGLAESLYAFTNVLVYGSKGSFVRVQEDPGYFGFLEDDVSPNTQRHLRQDENLEEEELQRTRKLPQGGGGGGKGGGGSDGGGGGGGDQCAAAEEEAKDCGAKGNIPKSCCSDTTCAADGTACQLVNYPPGSGGSRRLSISKPGILVVG